VGGGARYESWVSTRLGYTVCQDIRYNFVSLVCAWGGLVGSPEADRRAQPQPTPRGKTQGIGAALPQVDSLHIHVSAHHQRLPDALDLDSPSGQNLAHQPALSLPVQTSGRVQPSHLVSIGYSHSRTAPRVPPRADSIPLARPLHPQRFMRPQIVVDLPKFFQCLAPLSHLLRPAAMPGIASFNVRWNRSTFPLRLRIMHSPVNQSSPLPLAARGTLERGSLLPLWYAPKSACASARRSLLRRSQREERRPGRGKASASRCTRWTARCVGMRLAVGGRSAE